jgi:hypothetical protein
MSEREDHFDLGSGWPLRKDEPGDNCGVGRSPWFGVALFTALGSLLVAIAIGVRVSMGPPLFAPTESPRPQRFDGPTVKSMPKDELRKIAIAEVKKREGWSGKALGPTPQEGSECSVLVERDPENPKGQAVQVVLESVTGAIVDYRKVQSDAAEPGPSRKMKAGGKQAAEVKLEANAAEAAQAWKKLLDAMAGRDEKRIRELTTPAGFEALKKGFGNQDLMHVFERMGKYWQECETRWRHLDGPDRVECSVGPEEKEHGFVFKKTAEGWKLDEWYPGS